MNTIKNLFWNGEEGRVRAGYRTIIAIIVFLILTNVYLFLINSAGMMLIYSSESSLWVFLISGTLRVLPAVLALWLVGRFIDRRKISEFGFHFNSNWWKDFGFGFGLGAVLMTTIFIIELIAGWVTISDQFYTAQTQHNFFIPLIVFFFVFICVGIAEEVFARGYLIKNFSEGFNFKSLGNNKAMMIALILTSVGFGFGHMGNANASFISTFNIIIIGVLLGLAFLWTGELAVPIGLHISWNFFQANIYGFPVSGMTYPSKVVTFFKIEQGGPDLLTGGKFGPEAGLLGLLVMLLGIFLTHYWVNVRQGRRFGNLDESVANFVIKNYSNSQE